MKLTTLTEKEVTDVRGRQGRPEPLHEMLKEFQKMGVKGVEVENHNYANANSGVGSIRASIKRFNMNSIECFNVGEKIYLVNHSVKQND